MSRSHRRRFIATVSLATAGLAVRPAGALASPVPASAEAVFDELMTRVLRQRKIPGGALAVVRAGRLVHARGYGWADREKRLPVRPDSLFRLASVSKPITAVTVMKWVEQGKLDRDARVFDLLDLQGRVPAGKKLDERWRRITVRQLLQHTGGWDRDASFDPMFRSATIARELGVTRPAAAWDVIRYMLGQALDFDPGQRFAYSNFGYCLLGRVIEKVSGLGYEACVKAHVLEPMGIRRPQLGASREGQPGEVRYYTAEDASAENVFPAPPEHVPMPYGGFHLEAMDAHGGWIASVLDLARFARGLDEQGSSRILQPDSLRQMYEPPPPPLGREPDGSLAVKFYASGWGVQRHGRENKASTYHNGSLPGTYTLLVRRWDGITFAALFNQRSDNSKDPDSVIEQDLHRAMDAVTDWPSHDLFASNPGLRPAGSSKRG